MNYNRLRFKRIENENKSNIIQESPIKFTYLILDQ